MTERAKLRANAAGRRPAGFRFAAPALVLAVAAIGCTPGSPDRAYGVYARASRVLLRIDYDRDGDGRIDLRTYMRDGRPVRVEADLNGDLVIERWEYYGADGALVRIGASTRDDGREDSWVRSDGRRRLLDLSTRRDGRIDRRETYEGDTLVRAETDANRDGLTDRWEEFRGGALVRLMLDEELRHGRPTLRIGYAGGGTTRVEGDADGDGVWEVRDAGR